MNTKLNDDADVEARLARLHDKVEQLERRGRSGLGRVLRTAGVLLFASALGFGALTAAGVEAFHIDEQGNIQIFGTVTIGGAANVGSLAASGAVSGSALNTQGTVTGAAVTSTGAMTAKNIGATEEVAAATVTATTITGTNVTASGEVSAATAAISGVIVDANGNVAIPGNLAVSGLADRMVFKSTTMGTTTFIPAESVARFCADDDGCEMRLAMANYDTVGSAPASVIGWLYCDANCKNWRVNLRSGDNAGTDQNNVTQHVLVGWSCYFTDGRYSGVVDQGDTEAGFGIMSWTQYPTSNCTLTLID